MGRELAEFIAGEVGKTYETGWMEVTQPMIDAFADATRDWNFLHVDPEAAGRTEFGGAIAHGFFVLSLLAPLRGGLGRPVFPGLRMGVNYGLEGVRWVQPVRSGSRIRAIFAIREIAEAGQGRYREVMDVRIEVEGLERPALVGQWLTMYFV